MGRRRWPSLFAAVAAVLLPSAVTVACGARDGAPREHPSVAAMAPTPTPASLPGVQGGVSRALRFPVKVSDDRRYLVDATGQPQLIAGEAAWSLLVQLKLDEVAAYAADRHERGFNALLVNLVEHKFADHAPRDAYGETPFSGSRAFLQPNPAYFDRARAALGLLRDEGFLVFLTPAYLGYGGGSDGWTDELEKAGEEACAAYGRFVGERFGDLDNIVWVAGGDFSPRPGSTVERCMVRIIEALHAAAPAALITGHWSPETRSTSQSALQAVMDLEGVYTYGVAEAGCLAAGDPGKPVFLFETTYENEHGATARSLRLQFYRAALACPAGQFIGARPTWLFGNGWEAALDSPGTQQATVGASLLRSLDWWTLEWSPAAVLSADTERFGAVARGSGMGVFYFAGVAPGAAVTLDPRIVGRSLTATFVDPVTGAAVSTTPVSGNDGIVLTAPGKNAAGDRDWIVVTRPMP